MRVRLLDADLFATWHLMLANIKPNLCATTCAFPLRARNSMVTTFLTLTLILLC
jgi:hypothetical protein